MLATAIDNLKNGERLKRPPAWTLLAATALALALLAHAFARGASPARVGAWLLPATALLAAGGWAGVVYTYTALPVTGVIAFSWLYFLPAAVRAFWLERQQRQRVTQLFSRFLDPRVVTGLVEKGETDSTLTGQKREITVLFSDIRGFTTLSEQKTPQEIVDILNRYFSRQVEVIFRHGGTLDKYIGDAIMAFWGAPTEQPDHARRALAAAREMEQTLLAFRKEMGADGEHFDIGIGLNSGEAVVGFIGSPEHRQDYTVIGDTVNTASRIEGATKGRARILVSEATRNAIGPDVTFKDHGFAKLKGKGRRFASMNRSGIHRRRSIVLTAAAGLALFTMALFSAEVGTTRSAADMLSAPKSDARAVGQLAENSRVEIIERRGAWLRVKRDDTGGWLRLHQVRLGEGEQKTSSEGTKMLWNVGQTGRSGASGIVATTGVRGLSADDLKTAKPDPKQVQALDSYRANDAHAREQARAAGLRENQIAHLAKEE